MASPPAGTDVPRNMGVEIGNVIAKVSLGVGDKVSVGVRDGLFTGGVFVVFPRVYTGVRVDDGEGAGKAVALMVVGSAVGAVTVSALGAAQPLREKATMTSMAKKK